MQPLERKRCDRMCAKADSLGKPGPTNARVAVFTSVPERGLVDLCMAGHAARAHARGARVSSVVTGFAFRLGVSGCKTEAWVIAPDVGHLGPVGFVVARCALGPPEPAFVRILVTRHAIGLQSEERRVTTPIGAVVTVLASNRRVRPPERPTGETMIEARLRAARPPDELCSSSEMLDMTSPALLSPILVTVEPRSLPDPNGQVVVA
jgi:hypothetical protein